MTSKKQGPGGRPGAEKRDPSSLLDRRPAGSSQGRKTIPRPGPECKRCSLIREQDRLARLALRWLLRREESRQGGPESEGFDPGVSMRVDALRFLLEGEGGGHE